MPWRGRKPSFLLSLHELSPWRCLGAPRRARIVLATPAGRACRQPWDMRCRRCEDPCAVFSVPGCGAKAVLVEDSRCWHVLALTIFASPDTWEPGRCEGCGIAPGLEALPRAGARWRSMMGAHRRKRRGDQLRSNVDAGRWTGSASIAAQPRQAVECPRPGWQASLAAACAQG